MKTLLQTFRQPIKTTFGILLITLAAAVLCVGVGQSFAATQTEETLNDIYLSAAFPGWVGDDCVQWIDSYSQAHPDVVKQQANIGIASAYLPELTLNNWTQYIHELPILVDIWTCAPYNCALLEITLTSIGQPEAKTYTDRAEDGSLISIQSDTSGAVYVELEGVIEQAIGLQDGYADPTGYTARLTLKLENAKAMEALALCEGERYLVYGVDYYDMDFCVRHKIAAGMSELQYAEKILPYWDPYLCEIEYDYDHTRIDPETGETIYVYLKRNHLGLGGVTEYTTKDFSEVKIESIRCKLGYMVARLVGEDLNNYHAITMTLADYGTYPDVVVSKDQEGIYHFEIDDDYSYLDQNGETVLCTREEYAQRYQMPTIAHLTGTAEEFLSSEEGALWAEALRDVEVNNHAFAFVGVEKMQHIENFNSGEIRIAQGRDFTKEELSSGAKVCIISKQLAEANGLALGDVINPQFYVPDTSLHYQLSARDNSYNPKPLYFFENTSRLQEAQSYTIVGIYEQNVQWPNPFHNSQGFTCNTIFAPKSSLDAVMQQADRGIFQTVVLHNGKLEDFLLAAIEAGYGDDFKYTDGGYAAVGDSLESYQENAGRAVQVGLAVYGMILLLYLLLYPTQQRKNLRVMHALGSGRIRLLWHVIAGCLPVLLIGTVLGGMGGVMMWDLVVDMLTKDNAYALDIALPGAAFVMISLGQLALATVIASLLAVAMTAGRTLKNQK